MQKHIEQLTKDTKNAEKCFDFADSDTVTTSRHTNPILSRSLTNTTNNLYVSVANNVQDGQVVDSLHSNTTTTIINSHNENSLIGISHIEKRHRETSHN